MEYLDDLMKNHPIDTETEFSIDRYMDKIIGESESNIDEKLQSGGGGDEDITIKGGFPPIVLYKNINSESDVNVLNNNKKREFSSKLKSVKLSDLLQNKDDNYSDPFISVK